MTANRESAPGATVFTVFVLAAAALYPALAAAQAARYPLYA
jgi:hypothetical protein